MAAVDKLLELKDSWGVAAESLNSVVASSLLGERMFSFALVDCTSFQVSEAIAKVADTTLTGHVDPDKVQAALKSAQVAIEALSGIDRLGMKRVVDIAYRGVLCKVEVNSVHEQKVLMLANMVKQLALGSKTADGERVLTPLFCESGIGQSVGDHTCGVSAEVVRSYNTCRTTANEMMPEAGHKKGHEIREFLRCQADTLYQIDPTIKLECAWFEHMIAHGAQTRLEQMILSELPQKPGKHCPKQVAARLDELRKTDLFKFVSSEAQSSLSLTHELVFAISQDRLPTMSVCQKNSFFRRVGDMLANFAAVELEDSPGKFLSGSDAITAIFKSVETKMQEPGCQVSFEALRPFHTFNWLMSKEQVDQHNAWVAKVFGGRPRSSAKSSSSASAVKREAPAKDTEENPTKKAASDKAFNYFK